MMVDYVKQPQLPAKEVAAAVPTPTTTYAIGITVVIGAWVVKRRL
jgi:hypothetical protein